VKSLELDRYFEFLSLFKKTVLRLNKFKYDVQKYWVPSLEIRIDFYLCQGDMKPFGS
jgi:hypothetical protein